MAQRTIHYLFGEMISNRIELASKERFLLGSVMPDAVEPCDRDRSHFKIRTDSLVYYDFEAFRNAYFDLIQRDDLYLGYYMHLVEDAFYRVFVYQDCFTMPRAREEVELLHKDYHILNSYIVKKYRIHNLLEKDISLQHEPIGAIANFSLQEFLDEMRDDFTEKTEGTTVYLTESMLDEFVETYIPLAIEEIENLKKGSSVLRICDFSWSRRS